MVTTIIILSIALLISLLSLLSNYADKKMYKFSYDEAVKYWDEYYQLYYKTEKELRELKIEYNVLKHIIEKINKNK